MDNENKKFNIVFDLLFVCTQGVAEALNHPPYPPYPEAYQKDLNARKAECSNFI